MGNNKQHNNAGIKRRRNNPENFNSNPVNFTEAKRLKSSVNGPLASSTEKVNKIDKPSKLKKEQTKEEFNRFKPPSMDWTSSGDVHSRFKMFM